MTAITAYCVVEEGPASCVPVVDVHRRMKAL
jgi:hypothetical protein